MENTNLLLIALPVIALFVVLVKVHLGSGALPVRRKQYDDD